MSLNGLVVMRAILGFAIGVLAPLTITLLAELT